MTDQMQAPSPPPGGGSGSSAALGSMMDRFDATGRLIAAGSAAAILLLIIGIPLGAWSLSGYALVVLLAAIVALGIAFLATTSTSTNAWPVPGSDLALGAAAVMAILAVLNAVEMLADLDQVDDERGGIIGLVVTIALAVAAVIVLIGALRSPAAEDLGSATASGGDRGTRLAVAGLGLDLIAWLVMLTIGVFALGSTASFGIALVALAVTALVLGGGEPGGWRLPVPASWIAVVLAVLAVLPLLDQFGQVLRINERIGLDAIDLLAFVVHAVGTLLVLAGAAVSAADHKRRIGAPSPA